MAPLLNDSALHSFIGGSPASVAELAERYARQVQGRSPDGSQQWLNWIVRRVDTGEAVGTVQATVSSYPRPAPADRRSCGARLGHRPPPPAPRLRPRGRADHGYLVADHGVAYSLRTSSPSTGRPGCRPRPRAGPHRGGRRRRSPLAGLNGAIASRRDERLPSQASRRRCREGPERSSSGSPREDVATPSFHATTRRSADDAERRHGRLVGDAERPD